MKRVTGLMFCIALGVLVGSNVALAESIFGGVSLPGNVASTVTVSPIKPIPTVLPAQPVVIEAISAVAFQFSCTCTFSPVVPAGQSQQICPHMWDSFQNGASGGNPTYGWGCGYFCNTLPVAEQQDCYAFANSQGFFSETVLNQSFTYTEDSTNGQRVCAADGTPWGAPENYTGFLRPVVAPTGPNEWGGDPITSSTIGHCTPGPGMANPNIQPAI